MTEWITMHHEWMNGWKKHLKGSKGQEIWMNYWTEIWLDKRKNKEITKRNDFENEYIMTNEQTHNNLGEDENPHLFPKGFNCSSTLE